MTRLGHCCSLPRSLLGRCHADEALEALDELAKEEGLSRQEIVRRVLDRVGSVTGVEYLTLDVAEGRLAAEEIADRLMTG